MAIRMNRAASAALLLVAALPLVGCEDNGVTAPSGGQILLSASPETVVIDVAAGENAGTSTITGQVFDDQNFALRGVSIFFGTSGGVLHTVCQNTVCSVTGAPGCAADVDCALPSTQAIETNPNGFATTRLTIARTDPDTVTVTASSGLLSATVDVGQTEDFGNDPPLAVIDAFPASPVLKNTAVSFDGSLSQDPDGRITCWQWKVTSGVPGSVETLQGTNTRVFDRVYNQAQTLQVTLRVSDNLALDSPTACPPIPGGGLELGANMFEGSATINYVVECSFVGPTAQAGADFNWPAGMDATLDASASNPGDSVIDQWTWTCNDGSPTQVSPTNPQVICNWATPGLRTANLTVRTECGDTSSDNVNITVQ